MTRAGSVPISRDFGIILICAVRYALGRKSYVPHLVMDYITPLFPKLDNKTLYIFEQDVTDARYMGGYGHSGIDEPAWMRFLSAVRNEREKRGEQPYKSHWEGWHGNEQTDA